MLKNLFEDSEDIIVPKPNQSLLEAIRAHDNKVDKIDRNTKTFALIFVIISAVVWIGGDIAGFNSDIVLTFGLMTLFGYPLIRVIGALWVGRPSVKRRSEELSMKALNEMDIPDDACEIELLFPKTLQNDFSQKKDVCAENRQHLVYADSEALYIVHVTGTARLPFSFMEPWNESENKIAIRFWLQSERPAAYYHDGVQKKQQLVSLIPFIGLFVPDTYLIPYRYTIVHTAQNDYLLCVPIYETEKIQGIR